MFNEILTGKASIETPPPPPPAAAPPVVAPRPIVTAPTQCITCQRPLDGDEIAMCRACVTRNERSHKVTRWLLGGFVTVAVAIAWGAMKGQMRDDLAVGKGYASYDDYQQQKKHYEAQGEYSYEVDGFKSQMCYCDDLRCAREVLAKYDRWRTTTHLRPRSDAEAENAIGLAAEMADCLSKHETAPR